MFVVSRFTEAWEGDASWNRPFIMRLAWEASNQKQKMQVPQNKEVIKIRA
jgi:hypothetical protein